MPDKLVRQIFEELFQTNQLTINEETSFALANCSSAKLKGKIKNLRDLTRLVSKATYYNFMHIN